MGGGGGIRGDYKLSGRNCKPAGDSYSECFMILDHTWKIMKARSQF